MLKPNFTFRNALQVMIQKIILSLCIGLFTQMMIGCGKIELTDDKTEKPDSDGGGGNSDSPSDNPDDYALNVCKLPEITDGTEVYVAGYIVGFVPVPGTLKNMVFGTADAEASNIVIADYPDETNPNRCAAVQLTKGTEPRTALNLFDHPENLGRAIYVGGIKQKYFSAPGIKNVKDFGFISDDNPTEPDNPEQPDKPAVPDEPDEPEKPVTPTPAYPVLKTESTTVPFEGC